MEDFPTYQKIPNIFKRSPDGKQFLIGQYSSPELEYLAHNKWIFTEKVDGTNIRVCWDGYNFEFRGRTDRAQIPPFLLEFLKETFLPREEVFEEVFGATPVVLFGEGYGKKIQKVGSRYKSDGVGFILFDVWVDGWYLKREDVEDVAEKLKLPIVPVVLEGTLSDGVEFVKSKPKSWIAEDNTLVMEGIIGIPAVPLHTRKGDRVMIKIKVRDFE